MKKVIASGMIGNGLEWYVYALFGQMATMISAKFFPSEDASLALMGTFLTFAAGFIARPFGGAVFGWIGDRMGRNKALSLSIIIMAFSTGLIGILPEYAVIGFMAPVTLFVLRIVQGLSIGGEFSGAIVYMVEHSPNDKRGIVGSAAMFSLVLGFLAGSLVVTGLQSYMGEEAFLEWGWRLPFLFGMVVGIVGLYIRNHCGESPLYEAAKAKGLLSKTPVKDVFTINLKQTLQGVGIYLTVTIPFYASSIYFLTMNTKYLGVELITANALNVKCMLAMLVAVPLSAYASDKLGRKKVLIAVGLAFVVFTFPLFQQFSSADIAMIVPAQIVFAFLVGLFLGPIPALLTELFPTAVRNTGMAISYNISAAVFGGTLPLLATYVFDNNQSFVSMTGMGAVELLAVYVTLAGLVSVLTLIFYRDKCHEPLLGEHA